MSTPAVDVLIPVYNAGSTVEEAVNSIRNQSFDRIRIILIDDGSTDQTATILERLAAADPRITVISKENSGIVDALNLGWRASSAPLIARHDADDIAAPDRFAKQIAYLEANPDVVAVSGAFRQIDMSGAFTGQVVFLPSVELADPTWIPAREPYLLHPFLMMRSEALAAVGGYRYVFHAEDADLYWRLQEHGVLVNMPDILGDYRINPDSVSSRSIRNGRIQSLGSQLAAISAARRRSRAEDLEFPKDRLAAYEKAGLLAEMIDIAGAALTSSERRYLASGASQKLRSLSTYRSYELDLSDCRYIKAQFADALGLASPENRRELRSKLSGCAARLVLGGRLREGLALCPPELYANTLMRVVAHSLVPHRVLDALRRLRTP